MKLIYTAERPTEDLWDAFSSSMIRLMKDHMAHTIEVDLLNIHQTVGEHHDIEAIPTAKEGSEEVSPNKTPPRT